MRTIQILSAILIFSFHLQCDSRSVEQEKEQEKISRIRLYKASLDSLNYTGANSGYPESDSSSVTTTGSDSSSGSSTSTSGSSS